MNGITYYQTRSPYRGDFTKNCSLNGFEIDSNFLNLEGRDIRRMYTRGCTLYAELYNGETISTTIDSCGGGSGSGSCDCEREINYLEGERDVVVRYNYSIDGIGNFDISVECRLTISGLTDIGEASSSQINNLTFTPLGEEEPYNSFEISGTYNNIPIHIYTRGALLTQGIFSDSQFQTRIGTCDVMVIRGTYSGALNADKENIFRFPILDIDGSGEELVFNENSRFTYSDNDFEIMSSTSNYIIIALSDRIGNVINTCYLMEDGHFQISIFWLPQEVDLMTSITWSELKSLRDNSQLIPGMQYRIIDYDCTTVQEDTDSAHHPFDIIVFADDEHTLNENARACKSESDYPSLIIERSNGVQVLLKYSQMYTYDGIEYALLSDDGSVGFACLYKYGNFYFIIQIEPEGAQLVDFETFKERFNTEFPQAPQIVSMDIINSYFSNSNLNAWELKYCLDNDTNRFGWAAKMNATIIFESKYMYNNNGYTIVLGLKFIKMETINDEDYFVFQYDDSIVTPIVQTPFYISGSGAYNIEKLYYKTQNLSDSPFDEYGHLLQGKLFIYDETTTDSMIDILSIIDAGSFFEGRYIADTNEGKGVIYYMKDEWNNECPYDFKNIQFKRHYLTDELSVLNGFISFDGNVPENISSLNIPISTSASYIDLDSEQYPYSTHNPYYSTGNTIIIQSQLYYNWSYSEGGNEFSVYTENEIPTAGDKVYNHSGTEIGEVKGYTPATSVYRFEVDKNESYLYTFDIFVNDVHYDKSVYNNNILYCSNNILGLLNNGNSLPILQILNNTVFSTFSETKYVVGNKFGVANKDNTFSQETVENNFGDNCIGNIVFVTRFNTFGDNFNNNVIGRSDGFNSNIIGNDFSENLIMVNEDNGKTFFLMNVFGNSVYQNTFGNDVCNNTFGNSVYQNTFGNCVRQLTVFDGVTYVSVTGGSSANSYIQNAQILNGTCGSGTGTDAYLPIDFAPNLSCTQIAGLDSNDVLRIWKPADLIPAP